MAARDASRSSRPTCCISRQYRDTSRILDVFTREHGRLTLFARGVRGPESETRLAAAAVPPLLLSWSGRGEAAQLTGAESARRGATYAARARLLSGFYLNELLMKLTTRHDPQPGLFDDYPRRCERLAPVRARAALRVFEKRLLSSSATGSSSREAHSEASSLRTIISAPAQGVVADGARRARRVLGPLPAGAAAEELLDCGALDVARRLLQEALAHCLEGRELRRARSRGPWRRRGNT